MDMDNPTRNDAIMYVSDQMPDPFDATLSAAMTARLGELADDGLARISLDDGRWWLTMPAGLSALRAIPDGERQAYISWVEERGLLDGCVGAAIRFAARLGLI